MSGSGGGTANAAGPSSPPPVVGASGAAQGGAAPSAASGTVAPDLAAWCPAERTLEDRLRAVDAGASPSQLRSTVAAARSAMGPAAATVPADVRGDLGVVLDAYRQLFAALDQVDYDVSRMSVGVVQSLSPSQIKSASERLATYESRNCA